MLKLAKEPIEEHLWNIYNLSLATRIFRESLKIATKKGQNVNAQTTDPYPYSQILIR